MERMNKEELEKELEKLKDFKVYVFEGDVYVKAEDYKEKAIENRKLKDDLMEDMKEITKLEEENKKLKEELGEYKKMFEDQLKEVYIKNTAEFLDKKFPKVNGFIELKDIGEL